MATQRTRSSRSKHCLAMRMATKVARESWKDKSLTWRTRAQRWRGLLHIHWPANSNFWICLTYAWKKIGKSKNRYTLKCSEKSQEETSYINITQQVIEAAVAIVGGAAKSLENAEPLGTQGATIRCQLGTQDPNIVHPESTLHGMKHESSRRLRVSPSEPE